MRSDLQPEWKKMLVYKGVQSLQHFFLNKSVGWQMLILLMIIFLAGLGLAGVILAPALILIYFPLLLVIGIPACHLHGEPNWLF